MNDLTQLFALIEIYVVCACACVTDDCQWWYHELFELDQRLNAMQAVHTLAHATNSNDSDF